jgi:hypothetical protein
MATFFLNQEANGDDAARSATAGARSYLNSGVSTCQVILKLRLPANLRAVLS